MKTSKKELAAAFRNLEREGIIESRLGPDGKIRWFITEKGRQAEEKEAELRLSKERRGLNS